MTAHSALSNCRFKVKANAARYAQQRGISVERAQAELTQQAERNNDSAHAARLGANDSPAQAFLKELGAGISMVDPITGEKYQLFAADQATGVPAQRRANGTGGGRYIG